MWFLREPGVVNTLWQSAMLLLREEAASPFHIGHKESAVGLLREDRNPGGTSLFHNIPLPSLKKAFDQKRMILIHSHAEGHNNCLLKQICIRTTVSRLVRLHVPPQICHC